LSSPINRTEAFPTSLIAPCVSPTAQPNRVRDTTPVSGGNLGTLDIRRRFTNNTGGNVTRLRFRITDVTTYPVPPGFAYLFVRSSSDIVVTNPCTGMPLTVLGTQLEETGFTYDGPFNTTLSAGAVTLANPLPAGSTIDLRFLLGVKQSGSFKFFIVIEALP
jgi:hypothetical protein